MGHRKGQDLLSKWLKHIIEKCSESKLSINLSFINDLWPAPIARHEEKENSTLLCVFKWSSPIDTFQREMLSAFCLDHSERLGRCSLRCSDNICSVFQGMGKIRTLSFLQLVHLGMAFSRYLLIVILCSYVGECKAIFECRWQFSRSAKLWLLLFCNYYQAHFLTVPPYFPFYYKNVLPHPACGRLSADALFLTTCFRAIPYLPVFWSIQYWTLVCSLSHPVWWKTVLFLFSFWATEQLKSSALL